MESKRAPEFVLKWNGSIANAYASIKLINLNKFTLFDVIKSVSFNLCRRFMRCYAHFWLISWLLLVDTKPNKLPTNFTWLLTVWILCSFALFRASREKRWNNFVLSSAWRGATKSLHAHQILWLIYKSSAANYNFVWLLTPIQYI